MFRKKKIPGQAKQKHKGFEGEKGFEVQTTEWQEWPGDGKWRGSKAEDLQVQKNFIFYF